MMPGEFLKMTVEAYSVVGLEFLGQLFCSGHNFSIFRQKIGFTDRQQLRTGRKLRNNMANQRRKAKNVLLILHISYHVLSSAVGKYTTILKTGMPPSTTRDCLGS